MKYRLLKDLPGIKKGVIFKEDYLLESFINSGDDDYDYKVQYQEETLKNNPDWFEPIPDKNDISNIKIICSAIRVSKGVIVRGHRHADCIRTLSGMSAISKGDIKQGIQGFMTSENQFVDRKEAFKIKTGREGTLYSEDLY